MYCSLNTGTVWGTAAILYVSAKEKVDKLDGCPTQNFIATIFEG
jgi:hypothetical protein